MYILAYVGVQEIPSFLEIIVYGKHNYVHKTHTHIYYGKQY